MSKEDEITEGKKAGGVTKTKSPPLPPPFPPTLAQGLEPSLQRAFSQSGSRKGHQRDWISGWNLPE